MTKQEKAAVVSIVTNCGLTVAKFILASVTASVALFAEAYHSFTDILSSTMVLVALRADRSYNSPSPTTPPTTREGEEVLNRPKLFASGNWQSKVAVGIGILLILVAVSIFRKVGQPGPISVRYPVIAALAVSLMAICSYLLYRFEIAVGEETKSTALIADGHHAQTDMLASVLVMIALLSTGAGTGLDRVGAGIIMLFIFSNGVYVLTQALRSYAAAARGKEFTREIIYEDILFLLLYRMFEKFEAAVWNGLGKIPGLKGSPEVNRRRAGLAIVGLTCFAAGIIYVLSGFYMLKVGEQAIVERFGKPLQRESPVCAGLHYHWPWPIERVKKADVDGIKRLTIGYQAGDRKDLILWTNIHYLREYSIITGEGPFLDVAMNVHYRIKSLFQYLYGSANPDGTAEKIGYQVLRETLGMRPFFAAMTAERDALETLIIGEIQTRVDEHRLGIEIRNVCFRDVHPPAQVAPAFEDVVSAQEDYETHIEQARGYRKEVLPTARASAVTSLNGADAYRNALVAESAGTARAFSLQEKPYREAKELTQMRMVLETMEATLADVPKYIVGPNNGGGKPDLWFRMPPPVQGSFAGTVSRKEEPNQAQDKGKARISSEEDLMDTVLRFQQAQTEEE